MGTVSVSSIRYINAGSEGKREVVLAFGNSYNNTGNDDTTGETLVSAKLGLSQISRVDIQDTDGFLIQALYSESGPDSELPNVIRLKVYEGASGTTSSDSAGTPAGTVSSHSHDLQQITGEALVVDPVTGISAAALNLPIANVESVVAVVNAVPDTSMRLVPNGIVPTGIQVSYDQTTGIFRFDAASNVTAATIQYLVRPTDSTAPTFTGALMAGHTHGVGAAGGGEVANGTNLSTDLGAVKATVYGF